MPIESQYEVIRAILFENSPCSGVHLQPDLTQQRHRHRHHRPHRGRVGQEGRGQPGPTGWVSAMLLKMFTPTGSSTEDNAPENGVLIEPCLQPKPVRLATPPEQLARMLNPIQAVLAEVRHLGRDVEQPFARPDRLGREDLAIGETVKLLTLSLHHY